jgi:hypothetical protein
MYAVSAPLRTAERQCAATPNMAADNRACVSLQPANVLFECGVVLEAKLLLLRHLIEASVLPLVVLRVKIELFVSKASV